MILDNMKKPLGTSLYRPGHLWPTNRYYQELLHSKQTEMELLPLRINGFRALGFKQ
jgi:hypothetical protein